jgi:regulator of RNase E activity RraB
MRVAPQEEWDFYPCRVDGEPASISLNLWFLKHPAPEGCDTLVHVRVDMHDPGEHGMGTRDEARSFRPLEDALCDAARSSRFHLVGRIRTGGAWQLAWYGPADGARPLLRSASQALATHPGRLATTDVVPDPEWRFLHDFLAPDDGSIQWMADRRVVDSLISHGDRLEVPRPVDHWVRFGDDASALGFASVAGQLGFRVVDGDDQEGAEGVLVHLERTDPVVLAAIHDVAQGLRHLAERFGGEYDGWGCSLIGTSPPG